MTRKIRSFSLPLTKGAVGDLFHDANSPCIPLYERGKCSMDIYVRIYAVCVAISETAASGYSPPRSDKKYFRGKLDLS